MKTKYIILVAGGSMLLAAFIFKRREKMFEKIFNPKWNQPKEVLVDTPKYTPLILTEDEALKRTVGSAKELLDADIISRDIGPGIAFAECNHQKTMTDQEKREFMKVAQNFTAEELELILDIVPVEMCFDKIKRELDKAKEFEKAVREVVG